jgi:hypothetical protein
MKKHSHGGTSRGFSKSKSLTKGTAAGETGAGFSTSETRTKAMSTGWSINPSAPPVSQLQAVVYNLEEELKDRKATLTSDDRLSIRRELERLIENYLKD